MSNQKEKDLNKIQDNCYKQLGLNSKLSNTFKVVDLTHFIYIILHILLVNKPFKKRQTPV